MNFLWWLTQFRTDLLDNVFQGITVLGEKTALIVFICILYWCVNKRVGVEMGFSFCISGLLVQGLKIIFRIPRPWILDPSFQPVESAVAAATGYSFPSGHTQSATSVYGSAALLFKKKWTKILCSLLFILIGFSRMYLGVHTPKDVITAWFLTLATVFLVHYMFRKPERIKVLLILMGILCVALFILGDVLYVMEIVDKSYVKNCCEAVGAALGFLVGYILEQKYVNFNESQSMKFQCMKVVIGLIIVVLLKVGLRAILGTSLLAYAGQYFLIILFIVYIYPMLFTLGIRKLQGQ